MAFSLVFLVLILWRWVAPDWCLLPLLGGAIFSYFRFRETVIFVTVLIIIAILFTHFRMDPESLLMGSGLGSTGRPGDHLEENWILSTLLLLGLLGCHHATQCSLAPEGDWFSDSLLRRSTRLLWVLAPTLMAAILAYFLVLGRPHEVLWSWEISMDRLRARFLGLGLVGGGALLLYSLVRNLTPVLRQSPVSALMTLTETLWRQTRREQSRGQQWLVKSIRGKR